MENFQDLMRLINSRENAAWEWLYDQYGSKFYAYGVQRWGFSEDEAWEVVYRTLETLVQKIGSYTFQTQGEFERFIYRVLINFLKKQFRSKSYKESHQTVYVDFNGNEVNNSTEQLLNPNLLKDYSASEEFEHPDLVRMKLVLESFDPLDKDLLLLRAQNYSYEEIGQFLQIEYSHLKVRHHRAKKRLMEALTETSKNDYHGKKEG